MARRMDIELTSERPDGTWTWRAAGALKPRGVVEADMLTAGAKVGDVLRVEAEIELDGITITSVMPAKAPSPREGRIEIARAAPPVEGVTTTLVERGPSRSRRSDRPRDDDGPRGDDRRNGARRPSVGGPRSGAGSTRAGGVERPRGGARSGGADRTGSGAGATGERRPSRPPGFETRERPAARAPARDEASTSSAASGPPPRPARPRQPRLVPGRVRLAALLESLPPEQVPVAEQLAVGGLPAVRRALTEDRVAAAAAGRPASTGDAIVALAEQLLPSVREAVWMDRAEAADKMLETISLRDLRATVAGAAPRDEHGRELLQRLREALEARVAKLRASWEGDIVRALEENRVLQALRLSARPPEPTARFPAALVNRLAEVTGAAMTAETPSERWLALLEATVASPVRRLVKPIGVPADPELRRSSAREAGRVPALAGLLGLAMPPPPGPPGGAPIPPRRRPTPPPPPLRAMLRSPSQNAHDTSAADVAIAPVQAAHDSAVEVPVTSAAGEPVAQHETAALTEVSEPAEVEGGDASVGAPESVKPVAVVEATPAAAPVEDPEPVTMAVVEATPAAAPVEDREPVALADATPGAGPVGDPEPVAVAEPVAAGESIEEASEGASADPVHEEAAVADEAGSDAPVEAAISGEALGSRD